MTSGDGRPVELTTHRLPRSVFDEICSGPVSSAGIAILRNGQHSLRRLRLRALVEAVEPLAPRLGPFADVEHAWALLADAERKAPAIVEEVLMHPSVGVWLSRVLRHALGIAPDATPLRAEVGGFHALAAAAAVRVGLPCEIAVPVVHGAVSLPSVGAFRLGTGFPVGHALLRRAVSGAITLTVFGNTRAVPLDAVKRHRSTARGRTVDIAFDDLDPYREFGSPVRARPLGDAEYDEWRKLMDEAWRLLTDAHPGWAEELSAGLAAVVPLDPARDVFAASSAAAFGSVAMSPKRSAVKFGEALVHELQHSKVNALMDLVDLDDGDEDERHYAPWRDDPRPVAGLLHGVYAFVSVVEYWDVQRHRLPVDQVAPAHFSHALRARQVGEAVSALRGLTGLTDLGREFAAAVAVRLAACEPVDPSAELAEVVTMLMDAHRATWRLRHAHPNRPAVADLAAAWVDGGPAYLAPAPEIVPSGRSGDSRLTALLRLRALDPYRYGRSADGSGPEGALLRGDRAAAAAGFLARLRDTSRDIPSWVGLGLALDSTALRRTPELVRAVHHRISARTGVAPDPAGLAAWFDQAAG